MTSQRFSLGLCVALTVALCAGARAAEPGASDWSIGKLSSARLISAGGLAGKSYLAGIEIRLNGDAHTYWRNPGDAGVPPTIDFAASTNLASARARYPAPTRIVEDGADVFGYRGAVTLPIEVTPTDPAKPVELALDLQYAACERICVPVEAHARLTLEPAVASTPFAEPLRAIQAALPAPLGPSGPSLAATARAGVAKPSWVVTIAPPSANGADLFAEAPEGWYFSTARRPDGGFDLVADQSPSDHGGHIEVALTYFDGTRAFDAPLRLDLTGPPH